MSAGWLSSEAELLEHEGLVPLLPALPHLTLRHVVQDEAVELHRLAGRGRSAQRPGMRTRGAPPERHPIPLDQLILHREVEVGESAQEPRHELLPRADPAEW